MRIQLPPCQFPVIGKTERRLPFSLPLYLSTVSSLGPPTLRLVIINIMTCVRTKSRLDGDQLKNAIRNYGHLGPTLTLSL